MHANLLAIVGAAASLTFTAVPAYAASIDISGTFLDHNGVPVAESWVGIYDLTAGTQQTAVTDGSGGFVFSATRGDSLTISVRPLVNPGPYEPLGPMADADGVARPGPIYIVQDVTEFVPPPSIVGTNGDDVITGTPDRDVIFAGDGSDTIDGVDGADIILGGYGDDTIYGGAGADVLVAGSGNDTVYGGPGADTVTGDEGADTLRGEGGNDRISDFNYDSAAVNRLIGGVGDDVIFMGSNAWGETVPRSYLFGGAGNDTITSSGFAIVRAGAGDDLVYGVLRGGKTYCGDGADIAYPNNTVQPVDFYDRCEQIVVLA